MVFWLVVESLFASDARLPRLQPGHTLPADVDVGEKVLGAVERGTGPSLMCTQIYVRSIFVCQFFIVDLVFSAKFA